VGARRDLLLVEVGHDLLTALAQVLGVVDPAQVVDRSRCLAAGAVPVIDGHGEEALATVADRARFLAVVQHDRRAQRRQVLDREIGDLRLARAALDRRAVGAVLLLHVLGPAEAQDQAAQSPLAGLVECLLARAGEEHRRVRVLVRSRDDRPRRDVDQLAVVLELRLAPHARDHARGLLELRGNLAHLGLEGARLLGCTPLADAEVQPALAQDVEHRDPLRHLDRMIHPEGQTHDAVPDANALGLARHVGQERLRGAHVRVPFQAVMLDGPDAIEAHLLRQHRLLDTLVHDLELGFAGRVDDLCLEDHGKFHGT
jgi:hypothetical protein